MCSFRIDATAQCISSISYALPHRSMPKNILASMLTPNFLPISERKKMRQFCWNRYAWHLWRHSIWWRHAVAFFAIPTNIQFRWRNKWMKMSVIAVYAKHDRSLCQVHCRSDNRCDRHFNIQNAMACEYETRGQTNLCQLFDFVCACVALCGQFSCIWATFFPRQHPCESL